MTKKDVNGAGKVETAEVAPYMSKNIENKDEATSSSSLLIPAIIVIVLSTVIINSFFEDEYKAVIEGFSAQMDTSSGDTASTSSQHTPASDSLLVTELENQASSVGTETTSPSQAVSQLPAAQGRNTLYQPYAYTYPHPYAPTYRAVPYGYQAPYSRPPQQASAYDEAMQQRQKFITEVQNRREKAIERMEKQRQERQDEIDKWRAETEKDHADWVKRMKDKYPSRSL